MHSRRMERERDTVMKLSESLLLRLRSGISSLKLSLFPKRSFNHHLQLPRHQLASTLQPWVECPLALLLKVSLVDLRRQPEDLPLTMPVLLLLELPPVVQSLYPQRRPGCPHDHRNHRPDTPTQPTSTQAASDRPLGLLHKAFQLRLPPVSQLLPKVHPVLLVLLHLVSGLLQAFNHLLDSVGDCHLRHKHLMQSIPSVSSRLDRVQDLD